MSKRVRAMLAHNINAARGHVHMYAAAREAGIQKGDNNFIPDEAQKIALDEAIVVAKVIHAGTRGHIIQQLTDMLKEQDLDFAKVLGLSNQTIASVASVLISEVSLVGALAVMQGVDVSKAMGDYYEKEADALAACFQDADEAQNEDPIAMSTFGDLNPDGTLTDVPARPGSVVN